MARRRRRSREIAFSFDAFLDLVANVVGIILRLILVTWVGARSYKAFVPPPPPPPVIAEEPQLSEPVDPRQELLVRQRETLRDTEARVRQQHARAADAGATAERLRRDLLALTHRRRQLEGEQTRWRDQAERRPASAPGGSLSAADLEKRSRELLTEVAALRKLPPPRRELRYRTPVSATVQSEELMIECRRGRVAVIDTGTMLDEARRSLRGHVDALRTQWQVKATTAPVGAFRIRYIIERQRDLLDSPAGVPPMDGTFRYGLSGWEVEPIRAERGESAEQALTDGSAYRQVIDRLDPGQTAVTFWVYPDSFALYRQLRDHLHDRGLVVAGRPLPDGAAIASSRSGTHSRGQ